MRNIHRLIKEANAQVPVGEQFVSDLKRAIEIEHGKTTRAPSKSYKPSSLLCVRNMWYQVIGQEPEPSSFDACLIGIVQTGSARHDALQELFVKMSDGSLGMDLQYIYVPDFIEERGLSYLDIVSQQGHETKLYHRDLNISFLCDGIVKYKGKHYILEIKTETTYKFSLREAIEPDHISQGTAYSLCFGIPDVLFLYECRDNSDKKAYHLRVSERMKKELVLDKIAESNRHVRLNTPPPKPMGLHKRTCNYCNYKNACKLAGD